MRQRFCCICLQWLHDQFASASTWVDIHVQCCSDKSIVVKPATASACRGCMFPVASISIHLQLHLLAFVTYVHFNGNTFNPHACQHCEKQLQCAYICLQLLFHCCNQCSWCLLSSPWTCNDIADIAAELQIQYQKPNNQYMNASLETSILFFTCIVRACLQINACYTR